MQQCKHISDVQTLETESGIKKQKQTQAQKCAIYCAIKDILQINWSFKRWSEWNIIYAVTFEMCPYFFFLKKKKTSLVPGVKFKLMFIKYLLSSFPSLQNESATCWLFSITGRHKAAATRFWDFLKKNYKISSLLNSVLTLTHFKWVNVWK